MSRALGLHCLSRVAAMRDGIVGQMLYKVVFNIFMKKGREGRKGRESKPKKFAPLELYNTRNTPSYVASFLPATRSTPDNVHPWLGAKQTMQRFTSRSLEEFFVSPQQIRHNRGAPSLLQSRHGCPGMCIVYHGLLSLAGKAVDEGQMKSRPKKRKRDTEDYHLSFQFYYHWFLPLPCTVSSRPWCLACLFHPVEQDGLLNSPPCICPLLVLYGAQITLDSWANNNQQQKSLKSFLSLFHGNKISSHSRMTKARVTESNKLEELVESSHKLHIKDMAGWAVLWFFHP